MSVDACRDVVPATDVVVAGYDRGFAELRIARDFRLRRRTSVPGLPGQRSAAASIDHLAEPEPPPLQRHAGFGKRREGRMYSRAEAGTPAHDRKLFAERSTAWRRRKIRRSVAAFSPSESLRGRKHCLGWEFWKTTRPGLGSTRSSMTDSPYWHLQKWPRDSTPSCRNWSVPS